MNKLEIQLGKKSQAFNFPSDWDELKGRQLSKLIPLLPVLNHALSRLKKVGESSFLSRSLDANVQELRIKALWILLDLPWWNYKAQKTILGLYPDEVAPVLEAVDFLVTQPKRYKMPFERLKVKGTLYVGPGDRISALTAEEYHFALLKLQELAQANEKEDADELEVKRLTQELCFVLYRPKGKGPVFNPMDPQYKGDERIPFNRHGWELQSEVLSRVPFWKLQVIVWWFGQMNRMIQDAHPRIFGSGKGEKGNGWLPIFRLMAKDPLKTQEIGNLKLGTLLWELNEQIKEADRVKSKNPKHGS